MMMMKRYNLSISELSCRGILKNKISNYVECKNSATQNSLGCLLRELLLIKERTFEFMCDSSTFLTLDEIEFIVNCISLNDIHFD